MPAIVAAAAVGIGAVPRVLLAADALPAWLRPFAWSDVLYTWERSLSGGRLPYWDAIFEYPPITGYVATVLSAATDTAAAYTIAWTVVQMGAAAIIGAVLAQACDPRRTLLRWSLAPQLALLGSLNFDLLAVAALVLAIEWARRGRLPAATMALAAGTAAKLFPLAAFPVLLLRALRDADGGSLDRADGPLATGRGLRLGLGLTVLFVAFVAAFYAPATAAKYSAIDGVSRYALVEPNFDSVWGFGQATLRGLGLAGTDALVVLGSSAGLLLTYAFVVLPRARAADVAVPAGLAVLALLLWTRLYSPQFSLWMLPFFALLPLSGRSFAMLATADVTVFATVYPLTLTAWTGPAPVRDALLVMLGAGVALRHVALVLAALELARIGRPR